MIAINFAVVKPHHIATGLAAFRPQGHVLNLSKTTGLREKTLVPIPEPNSYRDAYIKCQVYGLSHHSGRLHWSFECARRDSFA